MFVMLISFQHDVTSLRMMSSTSFC